MFKIVTNFPLIYFIHLFILKYQIVITQKTKKNGDKKRHDEEKMVGRKMVVWSKMMVCELPFFQY